MKNLPDISELDSDQLLQLASRCYAKKDEIEMEKKADLSIDILKAFVETTRIEFSHHSCSPEVDIFDDDAFHKVCSGHPDYGYHCSIVINKDYEIRIDDSDTRLRFCGDIVSLYGDSPFEDHTSIWTIHMLNFLKSIGYSKEKIGFKRADDQIRREEKNLQEKKDTIEFIKKTVESILTETK